MEYHGYTLTTAGDEVPISEQAIGAAATRAHPSQNTRPGGTPWLAPRDLLLDEPSKD